MKRSKNIAFQTDVKDVDMEKVDIPKKVNLITLLSNREVKTNTKGLEERSLKQWAESDMLSKCSAVYCQLTPPPRSTIAAAFSQDGKILASTHGDHTVKLICCRTGRCLKVLSGHRRTPWVVRFHPRTSHIVASGSLDHEVRIWNASSSDCIATWDFGRPIASLAFHAHGDVLAIASGHKLHIWHYSGNVADARPVAVLRTKRSLRAVHFHPFGAPIILSAEVNDQDTTQDLPEAHCSKAWRSALSDYAQNMVFNEGQPSAEDGGEASEEASDSDPRMRVPGRNVLSQSPRRRSSNNIARRLSDGNGNVTASTSGAEGANPPQNNRRWQGLSGIFRTGMSSAQGGSRNSETTAAAAAVAAATAAISQDVPCTVRLRIWPFNISNPHKALDKEILEIRHAVLCSEMGAHFSPCGRYLAACIACHPPPDMVIDNTPLGPVTALFYELRIYSIESGSFGEILHARPVRAAHCLTSIQFSPCSSHLLLAYGRRHMTLLQSIVADDDNNSLIPIHTILEVYRVPDMQLVRVLPSAEDEVNVACFHPWAGGGLAYGTKEGKLRILKHRSAGVKKEEKEPGERCIEDELLEAGMLRDSSYM